MRVGGWSRVGIVLSVIWLAGAGLYQREADLRTAAYFSGLAYRTCTESKAQKGDFDFSGCTSASTKNWNLFLEYSWGKVVIIAIVPIPFGWAFAYFAIRVWRWIRAGFKHSAGSKLAP
jgi:hypothetical protein